MDAASTVDAALGGGSDADAADAFVCSGSLSGLSISAGTLTPAFSPCIHAYAVKPTITSLGLPFTVTASSACTLAVNGTSVSSGQASAAISLGLTTSTSVDITATCGANAPEQVVVTMPPEREAYLKEFQPRSNGNFGGRGVVLSADGNTLAVGTASSDFGSFRVYRRTGSSWSHQKTFPAGFGAPHLSADGNTIATGCSSGQLRGICFFAYAAGVWSQQATFVPTGNEADLYGTVFELSSDGNWMVLVDFGESPNVRPAVILKRTAGAWSQQAVIPLPSNPAGWASRLALSYDATTLAITADAETRGSGRTYIYVRNGADWSQQAILKPLVPHDNDDFGISVTLSASGDTLAVGARRENSAATGINGDATNVSAARAGAAYVFARQGTVWSQQAYVKASNTHRDNYFGDAVALSPNGDTLAVGAFGEWGTGTGINGDQLQGEDVAWSGTGAVYVFGRSAGTWKQHAYVKGTPLMKAMFGSSVALSADTLAVAAVSEDSYDFQNNKIPFAGAAYVFR